MKKIVPLHPFYIFVNIMFAAPIPFGLYFIISGLGRLWDGDIIYFLVEFLSGIYAVYLFLYSLIYNVHNKVILTDDKIIITGHLIVKKQGLQFPDQIEYDDIQDVAIICANANSLKKRIKNAGYSSLRPYIYYEITLKNGDTKWMYIECFSRRQRKLILNTINDKADLHLSYDQLERKDFSIYKKSNKKR